MVPVHKIETFWGAWDFFGPLNGTSNSEGHFGAQKVEGGGRGGGLVTWGLTICSSTGHSQCSGQRSAVSCSLYLQSEDIIKSTLFCKVHYVLNSDIKNESVPVLLYNFLQCPSPIGWRKNLPNYRVSEAAFRTISGSRASYGTFFTVIGTYLKATTSSLKLSLLEIFFWNLSKYLLKC